jgi:hypothetical protein
MPSALRAQVALVALLGVLLIPIGTSSLRGLTHILTCQEAATTPFTIDVPEDGPPSITSSSTLERNPDGSIPTNELCGGLTLDLLIGTRTDDRAEITVSITNHSEYGWRGSVQLHLDDVEVPVDIGAIDAGDTASDAVELRLEPGETYTVAGDLLIGP